jgi:hypothetical protein
MSSAPPKKNDSTRAIRKMTFRSPPT